MISNNKIVEIYSKGNWEKINFNHLKNGDIMRFLDNGQLYQDNETKRYNWMAEAVLI